MMGKSHGGRSATRKKQDERLSAYIDGELSASERARLEGRLAVDANLRAELAALQGTVALVRELPQVAVPRNFLLPQVVVPQSQLAAARRPWLARAAPLLTAASTVVSLLFVVALAGNLVATRQLRPMILPPESFEAVEAPMEPPAEMAAEAETVVTVEVEAALASTEQPQEKALVQIEEAEDEGMPLGAANEGEGTAAGADEPQPAPAPAEEAPEPESQGDQALEQAAPGAEESTALPFGTLSAERAVETSGSEVPPADTLAKEEPAPPTPSAAGAPEPTDAAASESAQVAEDEEPLQFLEPTDAEQPPASDLERSGSAPEQELVTPPSETEPTAVSLGPVTASPFPLRAVQIGLGSAAIILSAATVWAWRLRR